MEVKVDKLNGLMSARYNGNYNRFARDLQVDPSHLYRYINGGVGGGKKLIGAVIKYCIKNEIDFEEYVEF